MILRRLPQLVAGALLLGAGGGAWAQAGGSAGAPPADAGVPLQESKESLRQLQKERAQGQATPSPGARDALPTIAAPDIANAATAQLPSMNPKMRKEDEELRRKRAAQRNWLVDGMLRLEGKKADDGTVTGLEEDETEKVEGSDPDFLLKTYMKEQRAAEEAKDKNAKRDATGTAMVDPMAPFLREWLSGSPVEQTALAGVGGGGSRPTPAAGAGPIEFLSGSAAPADGGGAGGGPVFDSLDRSDALGAGARANPFLQGLDLSTLPAMENGTAGQPVGITPAPPPPVTPPASVVNVLPDPAPSRTGDRRPPPSALKENEKYFPQQRKF